LAFKATIYQELEPMTDHSILAPGIADLPFRKETELLSRFIKFFSAPKPNTLAYAIYARDLFATLEPLNDSQLSNLGIDRQGIAVYAAQKAGILVR
jgi:hypothetical protein